MTETNDMGGAYHLRVKSKHCQRAAFVCLWVLIFFWWRVFRQILMLICLKHKMCVCICLLSELILEKDMILWHCKRGFSEVLQVLESGSSWEKKHVHLFNSIPSCLYIDHGISYELRLSTLTWKGEWHSSGLSCHQSQRALSLFV